jgi:hypothetical protein
MLAQKPFLRRTTYMQAFVEKLFLQTIIYVLTPALGLGNWGLPDT